jgi:ketosteroid isomerase-like protein
MSGHLIQSTGTEVAAGGGEAMMDGEGVELIADLHLRLAEMYAGGPMGPVADLLDDDIVWGVSGEGPVAGMHRGWDAALQHFAARRELAGGTMRMRPEEIVAVSREVVVQLVGEAVLLGDEAVSWRVVCLYRLGRDRVRGAWLVPLDPELFDRTWTALDRQGPARR